MKSSKPVISANTAPVIRWYGVWAGAPDYNSLSGTTYGCISLIRGYQYLVLF